MQSLAATGPIGIFDSGVGGLSVLPHIQNQLPAESLLYLADQAHVPYGPRSAAEIQRFATAITRFFLSQGAKLIVVACNTATAAALGYLRANFPYVPFVGMEPAVKPGATSSRTGKVGVLATAGTFESQRYASLMARFASGVHLYQSPCIGLVELIEAGHLATPETDMLLRVCIEPMLAAGVDTLVLGCTHYPFVRPRIEQIVGPRVRIIDPAPAVARQTARLLTLHQLEKPNKAPGSIELYTTGNPGQFAQQVEKLMNKSYPVLPLAWENGMLRLAC